MKIRKQTGFTLVEIAIVLVVIGLLLGGILKGQQLINSARVRNLADQSSGTQAAFYGFVDRFRNLPGDMPAARACAAVGAAVDLLCATVPTIGGNGDGRITTVGEAAAAWSHLSVAGFLNGTFTGIVANEAAYRNTSVSTGAVPANAFQGPILLGHLLDYLNGAAEGTVVRLAYSFGGNIPVPLLRDLDQKLDDGNAGSGVLRAVWGEAALPAAGMGAIIQSVGTTCIVSSNWNVDSNNQTCNAVFHF